MREAAPKSGRNHKTVAVAQLAEHKVVVLGVAGSSPVSHPIFPIYFSDPKLQAESLHYKVTSTAGSISPVPRPAADPPAADGVWSSPSSSNAILRPPPSRSASG